MKKLLALSLMIALSLSLVACSTTEETETTTEETETTTEETETTTATEETTATVVDGTYVAYEYTTKEGIMNDGRGSDVDYLLDGQTVTVQVPVVTVAEVTYEGGEVTGTQYITYEGNTYYAESKNMLVTRMEFEPTVSETGSEELKAEAMANAEAGVVMSVIPSYVFHSNSGETVPVLSGKIAEDGTISGLSLEVLSLSYLDEDGNIYAPAFIGEDGTPIADDRTFTNRMETYTWTTYTEQLNQLVDYVETNGWDGSIKSDDITSLYTTVFGLTADDIDVTASPSAPKEDPTSWAGQSLVQNTKLFETLFGYFA